MSRIQSQLPADSAPPPLLLRDETPWATAGLPLVATARSRRGLDYAWLSRRRLRNALLISLLLHGGIVALQFGTPGDGLPWLDFTAPDRHGLAREQPSAPPAPPGYTTVSLRPRPAATVTAPHPAPVARRPGASKPAPHPAPRLPDASESPDLPVVPKVPRAPDAELKIADISPDPVPPARSVPKPEEAAASLPRVIAAESPPVDATPSSVLATTETATWSVPAPPPLPEPAPEPPPPAPPPVAAAVAPPAKEIARTEPNAAAREAALKEAEQQTQLQAARVLRDAQERAQQAAQARDEERRRLAEQAAAERMRSDAMAQHEAERIEAERVAAQRETERAEVLRVEREAQFAAEREAERAAERERRIELARLENERQRIAAVAATAAANAAATAAAAAEQAARADASRLAAGRIGNSEPPLLASPAGADLARNALDSIRNRRPASADFDFMAQQPRRGSILGSQSRDVQMNFYADAWQQKVERFARLNAPRLGRNRYYEPMRVLTSVNSDGTLAAITLISGSGDPAVDDAVRRIILMAAPYPAFPPPLKRAYDTIDIRRTFVVLDDQLRLTTD